MDTTSLRWFQQVADGMTVTQVSELEMVTQPGVSRALARLESEVGTPLLQRVGRTLRLTRAGTAFKRHVDALLHELDDGLAAVDQLIDPEAGTVTLAFQLSFGAWLVPQLLASFRREHPGVRFQLRSLAEADVAATLAGSAADLVITSLPGALPDVEWSRLFTEPLELAVPAGHRLADRDAAGLADVRDDPFIALTPRWALRRLSEALCARAGVVAPAAVEADDLPTVYGLVRAGLGVAVVPAQPQSPQSADPAASGAPRTLRLTDPGASRDIGLAWSTAHALLPSARLFRDHVLNSAVPVHTEPAAGRSIVP